MADKQPVGDPPQAPQTKTVSVGGDVGPTGEPAVPAQVEFGQSLPGQPPAGFPNGPGVDMYGNKITYAPEDPALRTGDPNEVVPGDPPTAENLAQMRQFLEQHGG